MLETTGVGTDLAKRLAELAKIVLDPDQLNHALNPEIQEMQSIFIEMRDYKITVEHPNEGETFTANGLAVSPRWAEMCMDDHMRTVQFLRGVSAAINQVREQGQNHPVQVLYAGCGPYATLAVPLMAILSPEDVRFTLIDLHPESIASARSIISNLGFDAFVEDFLAIDAFDYRITSDNPPDVIVMEVMQCCLNKEPQVALARHLMGQAPDALLVPKRIDVNLVQMVAAADGIASINQPSIKHLQRVFRLDKDAIANWRHISSDILPAASVDVPGLEDGSTALCLGTYIETFDGNVLTGFNSGLTVPQRHESLSDAPFGKRVQFGYRMGDAPTLFVSAVGEGD